MTVGLVCGTFDLCHAGHVQLLREARRACSWLVVGVQEDPSLVEDAAYRQETRGAPKHRPVLSLEERLVVLRAIRYVDAVFTYGSEASLVAWLKSTHVDVRIFGEDWRGKPYTGQALGHEAVFVPLFEHGGCVISSSGIRQRVLAEGV